MFQEGGASLIAVPDPGCAREDCEVSSVPPPQECLSQRLRSRSSVSALCPPRGSARYTAPPLPAITREWNTDSLSSLWSVPL